ncbi:hypothetical protein ACFQ6O_38370 [Streptomyces sp. NPDC056441]|uniref:hypothetical protein n=1 Tax=Streptomyces sp. NPDC056441 TaxID=3345817 RepID=UPI0036B3ADFC
MPVEPIPCQTGGGDTPVEVTTCCSPSIASTALCRPDGTAVLVVVQSGCAECGQDAGAPEVVGWVDTSTGTFTPGAPPADAGPCETLNGCDEPTQPVAMTGLCLADGTPISVVVTRDCAGTVTQEGWLNLTTGAWATGAPPAGTIACGDSRSIQVSGTFCDVDPASGDVLGLVLVEYSYAADGSIASVRLVDAVTGDTYTPQGEVTTCPAGVEQPERDVVQLCDVQADGTVTPIIRDFARDENGQITGHTDYDVDGAPYAPAGTVGVCPAESTCRDCTTQVLCDTDVMPAATIAGAAASGTLSNGVAWTTTGPSALSPNQQGDGAAWWGLALFPNPSLPLTKFAFDRPVTAEFSVLMVHSTGTGAKENTAQLPAGAHPLSLPPGYTYDRATSILSVDATLADCATLTAPTRANSARFRVTGVSSFALQYLGTKNVLTACARIGNWLFGAVDVSVGGQFLRTVCRDCSGNTTTVTDTLLDGLTPYTPAGKVGVCHPPEAEPCASTVQTVKLCDLNPTVEPDADGKRCAVPFLRHLVHDCTGALAETRDTAMDGTTPYTPVQVVDCGTGVPALAELLWPQTGIAEDPAGVARQDFIYAITNPQTEDVAEVRLHASSLSPGGCGTYDPAAPIFNNPTTYTLTLDAAAQEMSTFRLDLLDFDTFEGVTGLNPVPSRVEGDVTWNGTTITANVSNITAHVYWDNPPEKISYRYGNTGGGRACSSVAFQGMTLIPGGCCGCDSGAQEPCRDTSSTLLCDTTTTESLTVFDPAGVADADGWQVVSFTGNQPGYGPTGAMPYPVYRGTNNVGQVSYGARPDLNAGPTSMPWPGYDNAPIRWIIRKEFTAPQDGTATITATGFRADGGGRVRINGVDMGLYSQWGQPGVGGGSQAPVTAGPNTIEIEVRDDWGFNWATGRLDIAMTRTVQFMRRQVVDCETGEVVAMHDTTLDGEPYTVTGEVGQCEPVAECCEQAPPEQRVDIETELLCIRDEVSGDALGQVVVERIYDDQTGDRLEQRLTDPTTGDPVELPAGAVLARCPSPDRITRQICVVRSGTTEFLTNAVNATTGQDTDWQWAPDLSGTWYPMYEVAPNGLWTVTDPAPNKAHWVSPHANKGVCSPNLAAAPNVTATWYTRASWNLPSDVAPETIRIAATVLNADNDVVQWRLNAGEWQPVGGGQFGPPAWSFPPTAVPGGRAGQNEVIVQILETQPPSSVPCPNGNQAGMILHVVATYDHEPRVWTQVVEDGRVYYLDENGDRQEEIPDGDRIVPCGGSGACCPQPECRSASTLLLCDAPTDGKPEPTVTDTAPGPYYPYPTGLAMTGAQALWDGGALTLPPGTGPQPGTTGTVRTLAAKVQAPRPACDTGTAHVAVSVHADQLGPDTGCAITGAVRLFNGAAPVATVLPPNNAAVGWSGTLTVEADVPAADLAAGNITFFVALDTYEDSPQACPGSPRKSSWKLSGVTAAVAYEQTGCAPQFLRTVTVDCEGAVIAVTDTTLDGDPYTVTGEVGECTTGGGDCCPTEECRDTSTVLLCDLDPDCQAGIEPTATDEPNPASYNNWRPGTVPTWCHLDTPGQGAPVWTGGSVVLGPDAKCTIASGGDTHRVIGVHLAAGSPSLTGTVDVTVSLRVTNQGPNPGYAGDGMFGLWDASAGPSRIKYVSVPSSAPVGAVYTLTLTAAVPAAALAAGDIIAVLDLETYHGAGPKAWKVDEFTWSAEVPAVECEKQILRTIVKDCATGATVSVTDTTLDGDPYEVTGEVGQCTPASDGGTPQPAPCQATNVIEACRCDDTNGDGVSDTDYVELLAVDCEGTLTSIGTYTPDLSAPYTPVAPVPCETQGAPSSTGVQGHRVELAPGETWDAATWPMLQSVTAVARSTGTVTTADGTSSLLASESVTWSVARDSDALLTGPLTVAANTGTVAVSWTTGVNL